MEIKSEKDFEIKNLTTFKIGGKIEEVFFPQNMEELVFLLENNKNIQILGNLSNTLISSSGYKGKIILTTQMDEIKIEGTKIIALCGVKGPKLSQTACENGLSGFEFMIGFPGSVGGEICMNASAHSQAISDKLTKVTCYSSKSGIVEYSKEEMCFDYRTSRCQKEDIIVLSAEFELEQKEKELIKQKMDENLNFRKSHQPSLVMPNCGSIFKNPPTDSAGRLLESVGAKELNVGGARVWRNHANFIINNKKATSTDVLELMYELQTKVKEMYNIFLEPEIKFLQGGNKRENELWCMLNKK